MGKSFLVPFEHLDFENPAFPAKKIEELLPQRGAMAQLTAVVEVDRTVQTIVGYRDVRGDEFWCDGHLPGRPIVPGVLFCEMAAQLSGFLVGICDTTTDWHENFLGFAGLERVRFRRMAFPGDRILLLGKALRISRRLPTVQTQAVISGAVAFEGTIHGIPMPKRA